MCWTSNDFVKGTPRKIMTFDWPDGNYSANGDESLELMLQTHFPGSVTLVGATTDNIERLIPVVQANRRDWQHKIIDRTKVERAVSCANANVKVVFILEPGRELYAQANLSFVLNTLVTLIDRHIRNDAFKVTTLHGNKFAYWLIFRVSHIRAK